MLSYAYSLHAYTVPLWREHSTFVICVNLLNWFLFILACILGYLYTCSWHSLHFYKCYQSSHWCPAYSSAHLSRWHVMAGALSGSWAQ